jgi:hydrogenase maturation protease
VDLLILGLGNVLCSDDGLGVAAVQRLLKCYTMPTGVTVLDGGTLGLSLLPHLEDARQAILVDAVRDVGPAGRLVRITGDEVATAVAQRLSPHQVGVSDLLTAASWRERYPDRVVLLGLVPASLSLGFGLSPAVRAALPALVEAVALEAGSLGHVLAPRESDEVAEMGARHVLDAVGV